MTKMEVAVLIDDKTEELMRTAKASYRKHLEYDLAQQMAVYLLASQTLKFSERQEHHGRVLVATLNVA